MMKNSGDPGCISRERHSPRECVAWREADSGYHLLLKRFLDGANVDELEFLAALSGFYELFRPLRDIVRRIRINHGDPVGQTPEMQSGPSVQFRH